MSEHLGLSRRSLLGAAVTSAAAALATSAGILTDPGRTRLPFRLVVDQHETRLDRLTVGDVNAAMARGDLEPFTLLGLSVPAGVDATPLGQVRASVRRDGAWSEWMPLHYTPDEGPDDPSPVRATHPLWVDRCDGLRLDLPPGLAAHASVVLLRETGLVIARHSDVVPVVSNAPRPTIRPRSDWGAVRARDINYSREMKLAIVHHSAGGNDYSPGQVPSIIKGIQSYHLYTQGWDDIAYNFLVDKYGGIWEGREGGVTRLVRGGHTAGFNTDTVGICLLGNFVTAVPPSAATNATAAIVAWKLGYHGRDVSTNVMYTAGTGAKRADYPPGTTKSVPALTMHGDLGVTSCPGGHVRSRIPTIRQQAYARQLGLSDVPVSAYYAPAVTWLLHNGITTGVGTTGTYQPDAPVTRAQMATFLWRMMGSPSGYPAHGFPDVSSTAYYDKAVRWAKATGVTDGMGGTGRFEPNTSVTRGQMVVFLHRVSGSRPPTTYHGFPDVPRGSWYEAAVSWAKQHGITTGVGDTGRFQPASVVTRGQMAAFLHRTASTPAAWAAPLPPTAP
jgi:hypothetical protein